METMKEFVGKTPLFQPCHTPHEQDKPIGSETSIPLLLEAQAVRAREDVAIVGLERPPLTYGGLWLQVHRVVQALNARGLGRHDRVAIVLPNGPEMAVAFLAVAAGATCAPLNPHYQASEFDFYLADLQAKALIVPSDGDSAAIAVAQKRGISILKCTPDGAAAAGTFTLQGDEPPAAEGSTIRTPPLDLADPDDVALVLHTSGTTSRPKIVPLSHRNICASARNIRLALELTGKDRCLNIMPLFHIHGLIGATLSTLAAGGSVVCTPGFDVTALFGWVEAYHPTWYTAVPTMHQAILARAQAYRDVVARQPFRFIRSASAALPPQVAVELEGIFRAPVIESYGMTEASHQMTTNPLPPRQRKAGSVGLAAGPEIAIMDERGSILAQGQKGEIVIRGDNVTLGYENNLAANESAFTDGWFRTGDEGFLDAERYLFITGRLKEIINRGGEKISPREVDEVLMDHPTIAQAVTFAMPDVLLGEEVAAAVVLRESSVTTEDEIQAFAGCRLADFKVPRRVIILQDIPKGPTGKVQRIGLAETLGLAAVGPVPPKVAKSFVAPQDALERQLTEIWEEVLALKPIGITDNFYDLGGYSLLAVRLFEEIEKVTGKNLPLATLFQALTIKQLADIIRQEEWSGLWSPLVAIQPHGSRPPFFFIHAVSGNVLNYRYLSSHLGPDQPMYGLQARGLDGQQAPHTRIEDMASLYISEIRTIQPEGPYVLGGGSSGGIVAFEMAQQLRAQGREVALLALFDTYYTGRREHQPGQPFFQSKVYASLQKVDRLLGDLLLRTPKDQLSYLLERTKGLGARLGPRRRGIVHSDREQGEGSLSRALENVLQANREAVRRYVPQAYPGCIVLFLSCESPERTFYDRRLGWHEMAAGGLLLHVVPGSHETLFGEPHVKVLAEKLQGYLQQAR